MIKLKPTVWPCTWKTASHPLWVSKPPSFHLECYWQLHSDVYKLTCCQMINIDLKMGKTHKAALPSDIEMSDHSLGRFLLHWTIQSRWLSYILRKEHVLKLMVTCLPVSHSFRAHWIYGQGEWLNTIGGKKMDIHTTVKAKATVCIGIFLKALMFWWRDNPCCLIVGVKKPRIVSWMQGFWSAPLCMF